MKAIWNPTSKLECPGEFIIGSCAGRNSLQELIVVLDADVVVYQPAIEVGQDVGEEAHRFWIVVFKDAREHLT